MRANAPLRIHVLAKPAGAACKLACAYCFFLDKELLYPDSQFCMSDEVLEAYIRQLIEAHCTQQVTVAWQGGEPTLMGVEFCRFGLDKRDTLPRTCRECDVRFACHGECPKNRFYTTPDGETSPGGEVGLNYLCAGWKAFFHRIDEPLQMMAVLMRMGRPASEIMAVMAGKEDEWLDTLAKAGARKRFDEPCLCGSGLTFGECHGWKRPERRRKGRGMGTRGPRPPVRQRAHTQSQGQAQGCCPEEQNQGRYYNA